MSKKLEELKKRISYFRSRRLASKIVKRPAIPQSLEELQTHILHSHLSIEKLMEEMIRVKIWAIAFDEKNPKPSMRVMSALMLVVDNLPYRRKNEVLQKLESLFKPLRGRINSLDKLRNKFTHTELSELLGEYNDTTTKGAQNIVKEYEFVEELMNGFLEIGRKVEDYTIYANFLRTLIEEAKKKSSASS